MTAGEESFAHEKNPGTPETALGVPGESQGISIPELEGNTTHELSFTAVVTACNIDALA
jgi:hypothetical protein